MKCNTLGSARRLLAGLEITTSSCSSHSHVVALVHCKNLRAVRNGFVSYFLRLLQSLLKGLDIEEQSYACLINQINLTLSEDDGQWAVTV